MRGAATKPELRMAALAGLFAMTTAYGQSNGSVIFSNVMGPPATVNSDANGMYRATINGTVVAAATLDSVILVELREGTKVLAK